MAKKTKIFCVYCGTENILEDKKCKKCKKQLDPKNRPVYDYLKDKVKDKVEGTLQDNLFSIITNFIQTHLYGTVLTCSVIFTVVAGIIGVGDSTTDFDRENERPFSSVILEYKGEGLTPEEILVKYGDALNNSDLKSVKSYELKTFYPEIYDSLKGANLKNDGVVRYTFLDKNELYDNSAVLFKMEDLYNVGLYFGGNPKGKYGNYEFIRYPLYLEYSYVDYVDEKGDSGYAFDYSVEFIKVDGNYYISGTEVDTFVSISQQVHHEFLIKYKGDTTKFSYVDITKHIEEIDG